MTVLAEQPRLIIAYILMVVSQMYGPEIVVLLHKREPNTIFDEAVSASSSNLCTAYEAAHYERTSDILHASGMISSLALLLLAIGGVVFRRRQHRTTPSILLAAWIPPAYYLPAWLGHFVVQQDVPAVFTYGTTWQGWLSGETCAWKALWVGKTMQTPMEATMAGVLASVLIFAILFPAGRNRGTEKA